MDKFNVFCKDEPDRIKVVIANSGNMMNGYREQWMFECDDCYKYYDK